jgi:hypothetical protein
MRTAVARSLVRVVMFCLLWQVLTPVCMSSVMLLTYVVAVLATAVGVQAGLYIIEGLGVLASLAGGLWLSTWLSIKLSRRFIDVTWPDSNA